MSVGSILASAFPRARSWRKVGPWALGCLLVSSGVVGGSVTDETVEAFVEHVRQSESFAEEAKAFVIRIWEERDEEGLPGSFIAESLAVLSPAFRSGLDAYDEEQFERAYELLTALSDGEDPYLAANATFLAIKALVAQEKLVEARERLEVFLKDPTAVDLYTVHAAEAAYLRGYLALQDLQYHEAFMAFNSMLERYPEAGQRLRVSARQILAELRRRRPERIGDVADLMAFAGRRLGHLDTGARVQERQQRAIDLLDQLIEEAEQREQSGGGGGGGSSSGGTPRGGQSPSNPMPDSALPGGGGEDMQLRSRRQARPGEAWGGMPPAERERILQQLRDSFPSRYRQLVEQYYEELGKQP